MEIPKERLESKKNILIEFHIKKNYLDKKNAVDGF